MLFTHVSRRVAALALTALVVTGSVVAQAGASHALTSSPCTTGKAGFGATFWEPYYNPSSAQMTAQINAQRAVNDNTYIFDWAVDEDANNATWYPNGLGFPVFSDALPKLINALAPSGGSLWMGLVVAPSLDSKMSNNWSWLQTQVPLFERVADDLYRLYGRSIKGWYIPNEPDESVVSTYDHSYQYGAFLRQIDDYLHTHDGNKPVMIAPMMPSAIYTNLTPSQFIQQMQPMMAVAHMDVWNLEDGFAMTGWSPSQEAQAFALAQTYASQYGSHIWADLYTPNNATPAQWTPYLQALAPYSEVLSQWTFGQYLDPNDTADNPMAAAYYSSYRSYCMR